MEEIWKAIPGYEGLYQVSNLGNVQRINASNRPYLNGLLKQWTTKDGYKMVSLRNAKGKRKGFLVHRLVAISFVNGYNSDLQVNHKNEIKSDNRADNLEWVTCMENLNYGTRIHRVALSLGKPVVSVKNLIFEKYPSIKEASRVTGVSSANILAVLKGKRKHAGGYVWYYL